MTIPTFNIECQEDIKEFFSWLVNNEMLLHPDDSFTWIIDNMEDDGEEADITREQAEYLDDVMDKCFEVCDDYGFDIYELAYNTAMDND